MNNATSRNATGRGYEIRLQGHLHARWSAWFDGLTVSNENDGTTLLRRDVTDQSALHGLLRKLADLGLPLLSVTPVQPDTADTTDTTPPRTDRTPTKDTE